MGRDEFPRMFELRDSLPTPLPEGVVFPALDQTIIEYPQKRKFLRDIEGELQGLDVTAWAALKAKLTPLPNKHKKRVLQPLGDRQAGGVIGDRERHRDLTIVGLAQTPAVLARNPHGMDALLGEAGVVDDPRLDPPLRLDRRQDEPAHLGQNRLVRPSRLAH